MKHSSKVLGVLIVASVMLFLPFVSAAQQSVNSASFVTSLSPASSTSQIYSTSFETTDANGNNVYVYVYVFYNSSSQALTYESWQQVSAGNGGGHAWQLAGGLGTSTNTNPYNILTWTVTSTIEDPSYSPNPASSSNPPSSWPFPSSGFLPIDQPDNTISWGQSTSVTVTTGVTAGIGASGSGGETTVGGSLSASYSISYSWNEYQFMMEPMYQGAYNDTWEFSDNQGLTSTPYSATSVESSSIYAVQNSYNHVWFRDWGQFVYFSIVWWISLIYPVPTYDIVYANDGVTTPFIS